MKFLVALVAALTASLLQAQNLDDLLHGGGKEAAIKAAGGLISAGRAKKEADALKSASARYNAGQPSFKFEDATFKVSLADNSQVYGNEADWVLSSASSTLTSLGAEPGFDQRGIDNESSTRDSNSSNKWVAQDSMPKTGTIQVVRYSLELAVIQLEKTEDLSGFFGRFWNGTSFNFQRETSYCGITATIRDRRTGLVKAIYKVLDQASSADNVSGNIASGFFGNQLGGSYQSNDRDALRLRAEEKAMESLAKVLEAKSL